MITKGALEDSFSDLEGLIEAVDVEGCLRETRESAGRAPTRSGFLGASAAGVATVLLGVVPRARAATGLSASDVSILNYALVLEYLQASFYTEAEQAGALTGKTAQAARVIGATERAHVAAFLKLLGPQAVKRPIFDFQGVTERQRAFLKTAVAFEDLAVAAYKGQAPRLRSRSVLAAAVGIHSVEARHAAWMRELFRIKPAVRAFDPPAPRAHIEAIVASTHFIVARPQTKATRKPKYTG